jgi:uncharacterized protein (TIGR04255 family)
MRKRYKKPPIIEAVCQLRFSAESPWDLAMPGLIFERLKSDFPDRKSVKAVQTKFTAGPEGVQQEITQTDLIQFASKEGNKLIRVGQNVISVHEINQYSGWDQFFPQIDRAVAAYRDIVNPTGIDRIGLRYINRITFPENPVDLEHYLDLFVHIGSGMPQTYGLYSMTVDFAFDDGTDLLRVQLASEPGGDIGVNVSRFDLDYFLAKAAKIGFQDIKKWLDIAHSRVEEAFEAAIKDNLRGVFGLEEESCD